MDEILNLELFCLFNYLFFKYLRAWYVTGIQFKIPKQVLPNKGI